MDKIICVGKNYLEHAEEMRAIQGEAGNAPQEMPALFLKPPSVLLIAKAGETLSAPLPTHGGSLHHECEIVIRVRNGGFQMSLSEAKKAIAAVTLGLDMTLRDLQADLKKKGQPWEISKVFPGSAITGPWKSADEFAGWEKEDFSFSLDGERKQRGNAAQMRLGAAEALAYASRFFPIVAGDLLFTGTPAGVGPVREGQTAKLEWGTALRYSVRWASK